MIKIQLSFTTFSERNHNPPEPSSSETSIGGIGESASPSSRTRVGRTTTGSMGFAEAEANTVTGESVARTSLRECEQGLIFAHFQLPDSLVSSFKT